MSAASLRLPMLEVTIQEIGPGRYGWRCQGAGATLEGVSREPLPGRKTRR
jgi:hypothetical protein